MASEEMSKEIDRVAELLALRAQLKMGTKPQLRAVGSGITQDDQPKTEVAPAQSLEVLVFNPVDTSHRAKATREILRIARSNQWEDAIVMFLETKGVPYLSDLTEPQLDDLLGRMHGLVDAAENGYSLPDCLPAH